MKSQLLLLLLALGLCGHAQTEYPLLIAHRGGLSEAYPENSEMAFRYCMEKGVAMVETDLRLTKDGQLILFHDSDLRRMTGVKGAPEDFTLAELKKMELGQGQKIPMLEEALVTVMDSDIQLLLDIKAGPDLDYSNLFAVLDKYRMKYRTYIGVRRLEDLKVCKQLDAKVKVLGFIPNPDAAPDFAAHGADAIRLWPKWVKKDSALLQTTLNLGKPIWMTMGKASRESVLQYQKKGIQGFIHDDPLLFR
ncbi:glycerophosphodiester phosphodiesterase [Sediminicola luteus]|uniref:GP-PDE domain-containing protein n=1 Tax=Sediminicola luteus TaxID=319238 RepID=A0A2A4G2V7_9FLAO|nr:glycerophosphodiester phosphodiesterase family protein [Sediminicola luteus]PCE63309.1 hypothetical protein B7P33_13905 [Sediminicola luteus]